MSSVTVKKSVAREEQKQEGSCEEEENDSCTKCA